LIDLTSDDLDTKISENLAWINFLLTEYFKTDAVSRADVDAVLDLARERLLPLMADVSLILQERHKAGDSMLFEGAQGTMLDECTPVYETLPGWSGNTFGLTDMAQLPKNAKALLDRIEEVCDCPVTMLSTGSDREHICRL